MSDIKKIVIALGGNALQDSKGPATAQAQLSVVKKTCEYLGKIIGKGHRVVLVHGNGPQVGRILLASETAREVTPVMPFDVVGAMSQGYIGYHIQQALKAELDKQSIEIPVATVITQVIVDKNDPAFINPTKPIGNFYTEAEAKELGLKNSYTMREDAGRGWRRVVASPLPKEIVEIETIRQLHESSVIIAAGGGGIPVIETAEGGLEGTPAVIDKDFAAELLAEKINADLLLILTAVDRVSINYNKPNQIDLSAMTVLEAEKYIDQGHFATGSMLPKVSAAIKFVKGNPKRKAIIASLYEALDALEGKSGTAITN